MAFNRRDPHKMNSKAEVRAGVYELYGDKMTKEELEDKIERIWASYTTRLAAMGLVPPEDDEE